MGMYVFACVFVWILTCITTANGGYALTAKCIINRRSGPDSCLFRCNTNSTTTPEMAWTLYKKFSSVTYKVRRSTCHIAEVFPQDYTPGCRKDVFTLNITKAAERRDPGIWSCHDPARKELSNNVTLMVVGGDAYIVRASKSPAPHSTPLYASVISVILLNVCLFNANSP